MLESAVLGCSQPDQALVVGEAGSTKFIEALPIDVIRPFC
jgi:hypothetical protein